MTGSGSTCALCGAPAAGSVQSRPAREYRTPRGQIIFKAEARVPLCRTCRSQVKRMPPARRRALEEAWGRYWQPRQDTLF